MTGRDLIGYAVNQMGGDKLANLKTIVEELIGLDRLTSRAISLINPHNQYCFLEDIILEIDDCDNKLKELLKSYKIEIPIKYGWRRTTYHDAEKQDYEEYEWYDDKYECYRAMHKNAMWLIQNAMDLSSEPVTIVADGFDSIAVTKGTCKDIYQLYEM